MFPDYGYHESCWFIGGAFFLGALAGIPRLHRTPFIAASTFWFVISVANYVITADLWWVVSFIWAWALISHYVNLKQDKPFSLWGYFVYGLSSLALGYCLNTCGFPEELSLLLAMAVALVYVGLSRWKLTQALYLLSMGIPLFTLVSNMEFYDIHMTVKWWAFGPHWVAIMLAYIWLYFSAKWKPVFIGTDIWNFLTVVALCVFSLFYVITPVGEAQWLWHQLLVISSIAALVVYSEKKKLKKTLLPVLILTVVQVGSALCYTWLYQAYPWVGASRFLACELLYVAVYLAYSLYLRNSANWDSSQKDAIHTIYGLCIYVTGTCLVYFPGLAVGSLQTPLLTLASVLLVVWGLSFKSKATVSSV